MNVAFIIKGTARHKTAIYHVIDKAKQLPMIKECLALETDYPKHAIELARQLTEEGYTHIIAAGGDGTLNEVVNGIMQQQLENEVIIGHLPLGTANDFSRTTGIGTKHWQFVQILEKNKTQLIDAGEMECLDEEGKITRSYFINIADGGLGAVVVKRVNKSNKLLGGKFVFFREIVRGILSYRKMKIQIAADSFQWEGKILNLAVCNGKFFGHGMCIVPNADLSSGQFELVIVGDISLFDYLKNLSNLKKGRKINHPHLHYHQAKALAFIASELPCPLEADGEFVGYSPVKINVLPGRIKFLMP